MKERVVHEPWTIVKKEGEGCSELIIEGVTEFI